MRVLGPEELRESERNRRAIALLKKALEKMIEEDLRSQGAIGRENSTEP
jgi:hypothetical protein